MTPEQVRHGRLLLRMSQSRLAALAGISQAHVSMFETSGHLPRPLYGSDDRFAAIRAALEKAGVVFTKGDEPGVRLREADP